jgi:ketosteroid isomerase-like protein
MPHSNALARLALAAALVGGPALAQDEAGDAHAYVTAESALSAEDEAAIAGLVARMNHAIDVEDYALYASFYTEDGLIDSGFGEPAQGQAAVEAAVAASAPFITNKRHVAGNLVIHGAGDAAEVVYYLTVFERAAGLELAGTAVITDTMRRTADGWRVTRHQTRMDPATLAAMR